ncbi:hypothetical protein [Phaeospirillum tilakii]|uniref:Uncharacterized protein n=1 Tax=Phaeospirillum tilakii TaxID=741673 RepID=A0ABW5CCV7_9PROT
MTTLPEDQRRLLDGLLAQLGRQPDQAALIHFVTEVLRSLLRRQGDTEFREAIEAAFVEGVVQHDRPEQRALAAEVIRVVIVKRPEIARAWRAARGGAAAADAPARRSSDQPDHAPAPPPPPVPALDDPFAVAEAGLGRYLAELVRRRVTAFETPPARMPSAAYRVGPPFFLFDPSFPDLLAGFVAGPLLRACRDGMERRVYRPFEDRIPLDDHDWAAFMEDKREAVWAILLDRLRKLAEAQRRAEAKQTAPEAAPAAPSYRVVEKRVTRPRVFKVLGVGFTLGEVTTTRRVRVRRPDPNALDPEEVTALDLFAALDREAEQHGIDLPDGVDLALIRALLAGDPRPFATTRDALMALMGHASTSGPFLVEKLQAAEHSLDPVLVDILGMMLFTRFGHARFGLTELQSYCHGVSRDTAGTAPSRPFCTQELAARPGALVVQFREAMRRRAHADVVGTTVALLVECWLGLGRQGLTAALAEGLALFDSFGPLFADDPDRAALIELTRMVRDELTAPTLGRASLLLAVGRIYDPVARRATGRH